MEDRAIFRSLQTAQPNMGPTDLWAHIMKSNFSGCSEQWTLFLHRCPTAHCYTAVQDHEGLRHDKRFNTCNCTH